MRNVKKLVNQYLSLSEQNRLVLNSLASSVFNAVLGIVKLLLGVICLSPWLIINAVYCLLLWLGRSGALKKYAFTRKTNRLAGMEKRTVHLQGGAFLCLLGLSYMVISVRMYFRGEVTLYPEYIVYGIVVVTFVKLIAGVAGMISGRKERDPLVDSMRLYSFADACISIVVSRCAILMMMKSPNAVQSSAVFGMIVSLVFALIGASKIIRALKIPKHMGEPTKGGPPDVRLDGSFFQNIRLFLLCCVQIQKQEKEICQNEQNHIDR